LFYALKALLDVRFEKKKFEDKIQIMFQSVSNIDRFDQTFIHLYPYMARKRKKERKKEHGNHSFKDKSRILSVLTFDHSDLKILR